MTWSGTTLAWTRLRAVRNRLEKQEMLEVDCTFPAASETADFLGADALSALKLAVRGVEGEVCLALPASCLMLRVVELPSTDPADFPGMVELQLDKFCPYPSEHVRFSFEVLQSQEHTTRVLIAAVKSGVVEGLGQAFKKCSLIPHRVDADLTAWWALIHEQGGLSEHGQQVMLIADTRQISLIVAHHGVPVLFRCLGERSWYDTEEAYAELAGEIHLTLIALDAEWPEAERMGLLAWSADELPDPLKKQLTQISPHGAEFRRLDELPPLSEGLARRGGQLGKTGLNLALPEWGESEKIRASVKKLAKMSVLFGLLWLAAMASAVVYLRVQDRQFEQLEAGRADMLERTAAIRAVKDRVLSLKQYSDRSRSALECLREICLILPQEVILTSLTYTKAEQLELRCEAPRAELNHEFIKNLERTTEETGFFTSVEPGGIGMKSAAGRVISEFSVKLGLPGGEGK